MTTPDAPLVSIYIATRNRSALLQRALDSIRDQRPDAEVIVVDDGSTDDTPELLQRWAAEGRLRSLRNDRCMGACAARNIALRAARGRYVTGLDDDDEMLPGRITALLAALQSGDAFACSSDWIVEPGRMPRLRMTPGRIDAAAILSRNVVGNQILAERAKVMACGGYDKMLPAAQDYDLWIRMILRYGPARGIRRPLQRIHANNDMARISASAVRQRGYWMVYRKHRVQMDHASRAAHLYNLRRASGHATRLPKDLRFFVSGNRARLVWHASRDLLRGLLPR